MLLGFVLGFDAEGGIGGVLGAMLLVVVFSFGMSWVFTTVGLVLRSPSAVMNAGFMALFPLIFLSNIVRRPEHAAAALEAFVNVNPVSQPRDGGPRPHGGRRAPPATSGSCSPRPPCSPRSSRR